MFHRKTCPDELQKLSTALNMLLKEAVDC